MYASKSECAFDTINVTLKCNLYCVYIDSKNVLQLVGHKGFVGVSKAVCNPFLSKLDMVTSQIQIDPNTCLVLNL